MCGLPQDLWLEILSPLSGEQVWHLAMTCTDFYQMLPALTSRLAQAWHLKQARQAVSLSDLAYLYHFYNLVPLASGRLITPDWHLIRSLKHLLKRSCAFHKPTEEFLLELAEKHKESLYNIGAEIRLRLGKEIFQFELLKCGNSSLSYRRCQKVIAKSMRFPVWHNTARGWDITSDTFSALDIENYELAINNYPASSSLHYDKIYEYAVRKRHLPFLEGVEMPEGKSFLIPAFQSGDVNVIALVWTKRPTTNSKELLSCFRDICRKEFYHTLELFWNMVRTLTKKEQKALIHECRQVCVERDAPELLVALTGKKACQQELVQASKLGNYHFCHYFS